MDSVIKKTRKINDNISLDAWVNIIEFSLINEFLSLTLVVKGIKEYIKRIRPQSLNHIKFHVRKFPLNPQGHIRNLFIPSFMKLEEFKSMFVKEDENGKSFIRKREGANAGMIFQIIRKFFPNLYHLHIKGTFPDKFRSEIGKVGEKSENLINLEHEFRFLEKLSLNGRSNYCYDIKGKLFKKEYYYKFVTFGLEKKFLPRINELNLQYYNLVENGKEIMENLKKLVLENCTLNRLINFSICRKLKFLKLENINISSNNIKSFNLEDIEALETLIAVRKINNIGLSSLFPMKIRNLPNLRRLFLNEIDYENDEFNPIRKKIELSSLPELRELHLHYISQVDFLDFDHGQKLEKLSLDLCYLDVYPYVDVLTQVGSNIRRKLRTSGYTNLVELYITFVDIVGYGYTPSSDESVNLVNLDKLRIVDVSILNIGKIQNCESLEILRFSISNGAKMGCFTKGKYYLKELLLLEADGNDVKEILVGSPDFFVNSLKVYLDFDELSQFKLEGDLLKLLSEKCGCYEVLDCGLDTNVINPLDWS